MSSNGSSPADSAFDPFDQTIILRTGPNGTIEVPVSAGRITFLYRSAINSSINFGSQIGATLIMLLVLLVMTPRSRFRRAPTMIAIAALVVNFIRVVLLSLFYPSIWLDFYILFSGDVGSVPQSEFNVSITATALLIPTDILMLSSLILQAWSMFNLWPSAYKWGAGIFSLLLVLTTIALNFCLVIFQAHFALYGWFPPRIVKELYAGFITGTIAWFCFIFIIRLVIHMWTNRSILPSMKGLRPMDILVITNGVLMLIPVTLAGLQWLPFNFEPASGVQTAVVVFLPLGTLVAQRLANVPHLGTPTASNPSHRSGASAGLASHASTVPGGSIGPGSHGSRRPLLNRKGTVASTLSAGGTMHHGSSEKFHLQHLSGLSGAGRGSVTNANNIGNITQISAHPQDPIDRELAKIDDTLDESVLHVEDGRDPRGGHDLGNTVGGISSNNSSGVRVDRTIQYDEERAIPSQRPA